MITTAELISVIASVISAIGGAFAALAAFRSADSANVAQQAVSDAGHRASLRQISAAATEVLVEVARIEARRDNLMLTYVGLFKSSERYMTRRHEILSAISAKVEIAMECSDQAKLFTAPTKSLNSVPSEEIDRIQMILFANLTKVRALREDLDLEFASLNSR